MVHAYEGETTANIGDLLLCDSLGMTVAKYSF